MVTIKELAESTGVSRGTVDRVLHDRGRVSPEVRELVLKRAKELGYQPNRAGKILAARKQPHRIGVVLPSEGNPFFHDVIRGMECADREYSELGFSMEIKEIRGFDKDRHISAISSLKADGADAIVAATIDSDDVISALESTGLPFSAVNSDLSSSSRLCYVGPDYYGKGALHAGLLAITAGQKRGGILILKGSKDMKGHDEIIRGFRDTLSKREIEAGIIAEFETGDDDDKARMIVQRELSFHPEIDTLFVSTAGLMGAVEGIDGRDMLVFTSDDVPSTRELIRTGDVQWTVCQEPYRQGYESIRRMQDFLIDGRVPDSLITENIVRIKENLLA